jgi:hypothetical protein
MNQKNKRLLITAIVGAVIIIVGTTVGIILASGGSGYANNYSGGYAFGHMYMTLPAEGTAELAAPVSFLPGLCRRLAKSSAAGGDIDVKAGAPADPTAAFIDGCAAAILASPLYSS